MQDKWYKYRTKNRYTRAWTYFCANNSNYLWTISLYQNNTVAYMYT